jgi:putative ABC transport system permease protein
MLNDLSFTFRSLRRQPGFTLAAVATLAVGIAATTAIFSTVNAAILRPLPFSRSEDLFWLTTPATDGRFTTGRCSGVEILRLNDPALSVAQAAGTGRIDTSIIREDGTAIPSVIYGATEGFFDLFGMPLAVGRGFTHESHLQNAPRTVVLSYRLWRDMYGSDPGIVGKELRTGDGPATIAGVAGRDFDIPHGADGWMAFSNGPQATGHGFDGYLRVKPGTSQERLRSEMASVMSGLARDYASADVNRRYDVKPLVTAMVGDLRSTLLVVLGAAGLLLLLSCVNVTNLLLARGAVRSREIALRVALGAGPWRIVRQLLTESLVLSAIGTLIGLGFAYLGVRLLLVFGAARLPRLDSIPFDGRVLGFALLVLFVTGIMVGFAPAIRLAGTNLRTLMNESGRSSTGSGAAHRMLKGMIIAEIALAITLVAGAGWLVRSFANLGSTDPGFVSEGRLAFEIILPSARYRTPDQVAAWARDLSDRIKAIAGVTTVGSASTFPFGIDRDGVLYLGVQGHPVDPDHPRVARAHRVSQNFFDAMGVKLKAGRGFTDDDRQNTAPVAIVNRTFERRYLEGRDPLTLTFSAGYPDVPSTPQFKIIGVVDDVKYVSLADAADPAFYTPQAQSPFFLQTFVVKTSLADPTTIAPSVRAAVKATDALLPVTVRALTDVLSSTLNRQRLAMTLMMLFAGGALALAAVGIYGVIAYASEQRMGEVATRMALGATPSSVFWLMMRQGRALAIFGTLAGLAAAYIAGRIASSSLYEVHASDPVILLSATLLVVGITFLSILMPARRASQVDPSRILRLD